MAIQLNELPTLSGSVYPEESDYLIVYNSTTSGIEKRAASNFIRAINSNLTLYVSTTGNDNTGLGTQAAPWATPNKAIGWLKNCFISSNATITVACSDGEYNNLSRISIPRNFENVIITGENIYSKTLNSIQSSSGSAGNWSIVLNLNNVTNISVNNYLCIPSSTLSGGTKTRAACGVWKITNVDSGNNRITVDCKIKTNHVPSGAVTGTVYVLKTIFNFATDQHGVVSDAGGMVYLRKICLVGNTSVVNNVGLVATYPGSFIACSNDSNYDYTVGVTGFYNGLQVWSKGTVSFDYAFSSNAGYAGIYSYDQGAVTGVRSVSSGCADLGYYASGVTQGTIYAQYCASIGNGSVGVFAYNNSVISMESGFSAYNGNNGITAGNGASIAAEGSTLSYNGNHGAAISYRASADLANSVIANNTAYGVNSSRAAYALTSGVTYSNNGSGNTTTSTDGVIQAT